MSALRIPGKFTSLPDWDEKSEETDGALLFHIQPIIAGRHGDGSVESWDRQREGQILGPGSPEGRQLMQTAWNVARLQNDLPPTHPPQCQTLPSLSLPLSLYHTSAFYQFFVRLLYSALLFPLLDCPFLFPLLISLSSPPSSCSDMTQYLLRLNQCLHAISDSSVSHFLHRGRVCRRLTAT